MPFTSRDLPFSPFSKGVHCAIHSLSSLGVVGLRGTRYRSPRGSTCLRTRHGTAREMCPETPKGPSSIRSAQQTLRTRLTVGSLGTHLSTHRAGRVNPKDRVSDDFYLTRRNPSPNYTVSFIFIYQKEVKNINKTRNETLFKNNFQTVNFFKTWTYDKRTGYNLVILYIIQLVY